MGILERLQHVASTLSPQDTERLLASTEKVATGEMGSKFKFIGIVHPSLHTPGFSD
jgi:hypothetical protein